MSEAATPAAADSVIPAAPAATVDDTPAPTETPAEASSAEETSLMDTADPAKASEPPASPASEPEQVVEEAKWHLAENTPGDGEPPDWFKADKYENVAEQAKAYTELEKRFGAFTGAPKDGVYKVNTPEGFEGEFDTSHELFQQLNSWAKESQLSQKGYDGLLTMLAHYEAAAQQVPDMGEIKKRLGDNADARISSVSQWAKTNLSEDEYKAFRAAQTGLNAAEVFTAFEAVIAKTRQARMPKAGDDVAGATPTGLDEINAMQAKKDEQGRRLYEHDPEYRAMVEKKRFAYFQSLNG